MSEPKMPTPSVEAFVDILSQIAAAAFKSAVDPGGSFELMDLQMQGPSAELLSAGESGSLRIENPGGGGFLVAAVHAGEGSADTGADSSTIFPLRPFLEEIGRLGEEQLPGDVRCHWVELEEAGKKIRSDGDDGCDLKFIAGMSDQKTAEVTFFLNSTLCAALEAPPAPRPAVAVNAPIPVAAAPVKLQQTTKLPRNIDLIMDIELGITVSFGHARMLLKEVMQLGTGSIVELDRMADEQVDLWVNNKKVARGEVVIVGGNFGVRISEVESVAERISTLGG